MGINSRKIVRKYFEQEVDSRITPQSPINPNYIKRLKKTSSWRDSILIAAMVCASLVLVSIPEVYESALRKAYIPNSRIEAFKDEFPRVIYDASVQYKERKGV